MLAGLLSLVLSVQVPASPLVPDSVLRPPGMPEVVLLRTPLSGLTALRLSVGFREGQEDAADIAAHVGRTRMQEGARFFGARSDAKRTADAVVFTVSGADQDLDFLGALLRRAAAPATPDEWRTAQRAVSREREVELETGSGYAQTLATPRCTGSPRPPARPALVVASDLAPEAILAAVQPLGPDLMSAADIDSSTSSPPTAESPPTLRAWAALWWNLPSRDDPGSIALLRLVAEAAAAPGQDHREVRFLENRCGATLQIVGAAYPDDARGMYSDLERVLDRARAGMDASVTARSALAVRRAVSTPVGLVNWVGEQLDRTGDPYAGVNRLDALGSLNESRLLGLVERLQAQEPQRYRSP